MLGVDAIDGADQDMILSSAFPLLKIDKIVTVTITTTYGNQYTLHTHNYGYNPFFIMYQVVGGKLLQDYFFDLVEASKTSINLFDYTSRFVGGDYQPQTRTFVLVMCRNPLNKPATTPVFRTQSIEAANRDRGFGLKVAKNGKSADSEDLRDFTFHSDTRNLLVHRVVAQEITADTAWRTTYTNDLPYKPIWFAFISIDGGDNYRTLYGGAQAPPIAVQGYEDGRPNDVLILSTSDYGTGKKQYGSIWIFKDPFDSAATEQVVLSL